MNKLNSIIKIHGGKYFLRKFIVSYFPSNYEQMTYVEPFCGGCSIFLEKTPSQSEILNDKDIKIANLLEVIKTNCIGLCDTLQKLSYSEETFKACQNIDNQPIEDNIIGATVEYVLRRMSRGGLRKSFAYSDRQRGG